MNEASPSVNDREDYRKESFRRTRPYSSSDRVVIVLAIVRTIESTPSREFSVNHNAIARLRQRPCRATGQGTAAGFGLGSDLPGNAHRPRRSWWWAHDEAEGKRSRRSETERAPLLAEVASLDASRATEFLKQACQMRPVWSVRKICWFPSSLSFSAWRCWRPDCSGR